MNPFHLAAVTINAVRRQTEKLKAHDRERTEGAAERTVNFLFSVIALHVNYSFVQPSPQALSTAKNVILKKKNEIKRIEIDPLITFNTCLHFQCYNLNFCL